MSRGIDEKRKSCWRRRREDRGMRSIQYEKTEEKTKRGTAGRKSGIKESNKVRGRERVFAAKRKKIDKEGRMERRRKRWMKRQSEGHEVYL